MKILIHWHSLLTLMSVQRNNVYTCICPYFQKDTYLSLLHKIYSSIDFDEQFLIKNSLHFTYKNVSTTYLPIIRDAIHYFHIGS